MSLAMKCDCCGERYDMYERFNSLNLTSVSWSIHRGREQTIEKSYDLCPDCMKKVKGILGFKEGIK